MVPFSKSPTLIICFVLLANISTLFAQKELKDAIDSGKKREQFVSDSIFNTIRLTKNDTLRADLYFQYFEMCSSKEVIAYAPLVIAQMDSLLAQTNVLPLLRNAYLNRKAMAKRFIFYYHHQAEPGSQKGMKELEEAIDIYKRTNNGIHLNQAYIEKANVYAKQGKLFEQLQVLKDGLKYAESKQFKKGISKFYMQLQLFYAGIGDTAQTLGYINRSLALEKEFADPTRLARGYYLAGLTYSKMRKHQKAIKYFLASVEAYKTNTTAPQEQVAQTYMNLGDEYLAINEYDKGLDAYSQLHDMANSTDDVAAIFMATLKKGKALSLKGEFAKALSMHNDLLKMVTETGEGSTSPGGMVLIELAQDHYRHRDHKTAMGYIHKALDIVEKDGALTEIYTLETLAYKIDSAGNDLPHAYKHFYNATILKEKLNKDELLKQGAREKFQSELEMQQLAFKAEQEKKDAEARNEKRRNMIILTFGIVVLLLISGFLFFVFRSLRITKKQKATIELQKNETEQQKHLIEEKQKEIVDSITYAKRLQQAILPPQEFVNAHVPHNFILYKPKDIVAGDFYWAEKSDDLFFIAAADSTGHGVPGALVSVVCSNALNRALKEFKLREPGTILDKTRELVLETFEKSTSEVKDGMDISLLCINSTSKQVLWSGANNPLWFVQNNELKEIKADKQPIGKTEYPKPFTTHHIAYKENTVFYLFTDGLADQFGGPNGKKFKYKQFSDLLLKNNDLSQKDQAEIINKAFAEWKGELEQVDDVCVIGIRL